MDMNRSTKNSSPKGKQERTASFTQQNRSVKAYQIHFACSHIGRYVSGSKRKISWRFGLMGLASFREGQNANEYRGQEHEIQLIWSLQSKKTRVIWNSTDISYLISEVKNGSNKSVEFAWQGSLGMNFKIVARANASSKHRQYELFVDDRSFHSLPRFSDIVSKRRSSAVRSDYVVSKEGVECFSSGSQFDCVSEEKEKESKEKVATAKDDVNSSLKSSLIRHEKPLGKKDDSSHGETLSQQQQDRLASAGFSCHDSFDELRSDLYTSTLDKLRAEMTESVPQTEDMVSRAIIDAFSEDRDPEAGGGSSIFRDGPLEPIDIEASFLWDAFEWINDNLDLVDDPYDEEYKLQFMQEQVNDIVSHVRNERMEASTAAQIMLSVAAVLDLKLSKPVPRTTLMLSDLNRDVKKKHVAEAMKRFGHIDAAAVVRGRGFGICRFFTSSAVTHALEAANRNQLTIRDAAPQVYEVVPILPQRTLLESRTDSNDEAANSARHIYSDERPASKFPHLMESLEENDLDVDIDCLQMARNERPRSFPSYEPPSKNAYEYERALSGRQSLKNLSPSDGTTSTASSLDNDDIHFLSVTVPE